jgi:Zn-dependent protease
MSDPAFSDSLVPPPPAEFTVEKALVADPPGWDEELYQATTQLLIEPETAGSTWASLGCLVVSLGLFVLSFFSLGLRDLAFLIPVLFLHEAGHWIGMRLFGYRNVRMFFIPFFGAAVAGRKHATPAWQQALVLLLGPLPGIALALALQLVLPPGSFRGQRDLIGMLAILNGFNLLPLVPLDGGRLVDLLVFSRRPWLAAAFRLLTAAGLGAVAWTFGSWILGLLAVGVLLSTPARYQRARRERLFADNPQQFPDDLEQLGDAQKRDLFGWARLLNHDDRNPVSVAGEMRSLHEHMVTRQPGLLVCLVLLGLYLGGIAAALAVPLLQIAHTSGRT